MEPGAAAAESASVMSKDRAGPATLATVALLATLACGIKAPPRPPLAAKPTAPPAVQAKQPPAAPPESCPECPPPRADEPERGAKP
jgi:hypothetical protein